MKVVSYNEHGSYNITSLGALDGAMLGLEDGDRLGLDVGLADAPGVGPFDGD